MISSMPPNHLHRREDEYENDEERPLLDRTSTRASSESQRHREPHTIKLDEDDPENPRAWSNKAKLTNVAIIALMAIVSPLASSMFTPGIKQIAKDFDTDEQMVIATTTGFVIMLGVGPLVLAPFSETFGRRAMYMWCFFIFTLLQVPTALAPNIETLIVVRTISGFFGSVGIANGGGTITDMYPSSQRASIFGWYLLGPLLGPTLGPLFGGVVVTRLDWRWLYWIMTIICAVNTTVGYFFLHETYVPVLLARKKASMLQERDQSNGNGEVNKRPITFDGEDERPLWQKLYQSLKRPIAIFIQPIVLTMSLYQALIFGTSKSPPCLKSPNPPHPATRSSH